MLHHGMKPTVMLLQKFVRIIFLTILTRVYFQAADAEREKYLADLEQQRADEAYSEIDKLVEKLQKDYRRAINKSQ